jgi:hypothetical protein
MVSLRIWSVRQLIGSANLDRAITVASTVLADYRRLLGGEHLPMKTVAVNLQRARTAAERPRRRW